MAGFFATVTDPDVRNLASDVATISAQRRGDPAVMPLVIELSAEEQPNPVLGWYLRNSQNVSWSPGAGIDPKADPAPLLIAPTRRRTGITQRDLYGQQLSHRHPLAALRPAD